MLLVFAAQLGEQLADLLFELQDFGLHPGFEPRERLGDFVEHLLTPLVDWQEQLEESALNRVVEHLVLLLDSVAQPQLVLHDLFQTALELACMHLVVHEPECHQAEF